MDPQFFRNIVSINDFNFNGSSLSMSVLSIEEKGTKEINYDFVFKNVSSFKFWRADTLDRGYEVDVDDIKLSSIDTKDYFKIEFDCINFGMQIIFTSLAKIEGIA